MSGMMTPDCLSREGSPTPEHMLDVSQSAPGSPGNHSVGYPGSGNMIGHQQMSALVGTTKARLLLPHRSEMEQHGQVSSNGQEHREGKGEGVSFLSYLMPNVAFVAEKYHVTGDEQSMSPAAFSPQPVIVQAANYSPYR